MPSVWWLSYPLVGLFAGFVAGLFGVGGGMVVVPFLLMIFSAQHFPPQHLMHLALGTAMATIVVTSLASMRAHRAHGAVRWDIVKGIAPGLMFGTFAGSLWAAKIPTQGLAVAFTVIVYLAALQMMLGAQPKAHRTMPGLAALMAVGFAIGLVASLIAAGGGFLSIPFMVYCNVPIHQAVGTSSALGLPIAVAGTVGYLVSGLGVPGLPAYALGFIYLPAFVGIVGVSFLTAPFGARLAHALPVKQLRRGLGIFLALLATKMLFGLLG